MQITYTATQAVGVHLPQIIKRGVDLLFATVGMLLLLPLCLPVALVVCLDGGPVFFKQQRVGKNGKLFFCYKFRSMAIGAEEKFTEYLAANPEANEQWQIFQKIKNDKRVTAFGRFIRRTSIDEIPQLINVIKGDMSLVGPRPILPGQKEHYADEIEEYKNVRPGITGPWQVSGRNALTFRERVALDCYYARNWNLWMDLVILCKTVPTILRKHQTF